MDLNRLKIDRERSETPKRRRSGGFPILRVAFLVLAVALVFALRAPLLRRLDRFRLPAVEVVRVAQPSARAAGAVTGTAANGYVVAKTRAALSADTPGRIVEMNVTEGSVVKRGDVVARLYSDEVRAALDRAGSELGVAEAGVARSAAEVHAAEAELDVLRAQERAASARLDAARIVLEQAQLDFGRAATLVKEGIRTEEALDAARTALEGAQAAVAAEVATLDAAARSVERGAKRTAVAQAVVAEAQAGVLVAEAARAQAAATLEKTEVRAPFDGVIVLKDAEVGEVVSPNSLGGNSRGSVVTMVDFASLEIQVDVPETSLSAVAVGAVADIFLDAFPDERYAGRVERIWPTANRQKATVEVRVGFERVDERLRPEMGARVVFQPLDGEAEPAASPDAPQPAIVIPKECVVLIEGRAGVFALERDVVRWRELELGEERGGRVVVRSGLSGGEQVVLAPSADLEDGDRIRIEEGS